MKIRPALGVLASAVLVTGFLVKAAIGHVDDPKARDLLPPVYGPIYHEGQGSTAEVFPFSGINLKTWIPLNNFTGSPTSANDCWGYVSPSGKEYAIIGLSNGTATFLLYAALGLGSITVVAPLVAVFPLMAVMMSYLFLRNEGLPLLGLLGIVVSVAGVIVLLIAG